MNRMHLFPVSTAETAVWIAGGSALFVPVALPAIHGIAALALVGFGVYATGSAVISATRLIGQKPTGVFSDGAKVVKLLTATALSKPKPPVSAQEVPFRR